MNLASVWNIVWQDTPFHFAIASILVVAIVIEFCTFVDYFYFKCGATAKGIDYLKYLKKLPQNTQSEPPRAGDWLQKHFGTDDGNRLRTQYQQHQKFIIPKYPTVLARRTPHSHLRFVTTLCTSIGVLGTFYGIQQGLQNINLGDISNSQQLMSSSIELLGNMKTAFSTSLMGLGCGSLFTFIVFVTDWLRRQRRNGLRDKLDKLATFETAENDTRILAREIEQLRQSLTNQQPPSAEAIGEAVGRSIAEQFTALNQLTSEAIGKAVGQQMHSPLKQIFKEQQRLRIQLEENQGHKVIEKLIQDLKVEVIEPVAQRLDESAELTKEASQAVTNLHNELGGISQSLAGSIQTIQNFQKDTLVELKNFAKELKQTLNDFQTETKYVLKQTGFEINKAVEQSIQGMEQQREAFEKSANQAEHTFRGIREELEQALNNQKQKQEEMLQNFGRGIARILNQTTAVFEKQNQNLEIVGNQASGLMNDARENLISTLGNINQILAATRQTVQDDLTKFREEYQINLNNFFERQNNLLEGTLGKQRDGLAEVVNNLNTVFNDEYNRRRELTEETNNTLQNLTNTINATGNLANIVGLNSSQRLIQLQELSRDIGTQVQDVKREYRQLSNTFTESLTAWTNNFSESREKFFEEADSSMAKVCSSLLQTAGALAAANNHRNNRNGDSYYE